MLYSLLYGNKTKTKTNNSKIFKAAFQSEQVKNDVPYRCPVTVPSLPQLTDFRHGDDLVLCEATKLVEDMMNNTTLNPKSVRTYPRKIRKLPEKFGNDSKIFQNIIQLSNIYSQKSNNSFENEEHLIRSLNCPEVDPDAYKYENNFEFEFSPGDDDISSYYSVEIKDEPRFEEIVDTTASEIVPNVTDLNLNEYVELDENLTNWYDIYHRIDSEVLSEKLNNDSFLNVEDVNKKFFIKIGNKLRLICISVTDVPDNCCVQHQNEKIEPTSSKRRHESENEEQTTKKKLLSKEDNFDVPELLDGDDTFIKNIKLELPHPPLKQECISTENSADYCNIPELLDEDDTFVNAIKLEPPKTDLTDIEFEYIPESPDNYKPMDSLESTNANTHNFESLINEGFDGFQTGHGKPIDLPKSHILRKYVQLYENIEITEGDLLPT